ncbi:MAG: Phosphonopyruvate hydrolase [Alphaproteobacteria bacterium MarineAlpha6_Bin2]|nr:MAG: Phosphonopyruvate hydrolase [Alphaproteobacteria bacterium MarineAlpha6_Bin2]
MKLIQPKKFKENQLTKFQKLKKELNSKELSFLMEAHNGLTAKIAESAGFKGIWASGLSISTALGVRDNNEASWTQILDILEFMSDATNIPILVDGDTGYGNFNNFRRLVSKLCQRDIAGVCIEDKQYPKTNSFIKKYQKLADIDEFCGKIKAGKDTQKNDDFSIVARIEALIAGWGIGEAIKRAEAYYKAGADAVLIHSSKNNANEIVKFNKEWNNRCPVVIIPTTYYKTPTNIYKKAGISIVIWANHSLRAAIKAIQDVTAHLYKKENLRGFENQISDIDEVFKIAGNEELYQAEKKYLSEKRNYNAVVIAASKGEQLQHLTKNKPKCMLDIHGKPLLERLTSTLKKDNIGKITVVSGYKTKTIESELNLSNVNIIVNKEYNKNNELYSLYKAASEIKENCIICYGDIIFRKYILDALLSFENDIVIVVDALFKKKKKDYEKDLVICDRPFTGNYLLEKKPASLKCICLDEKKCKVDGQWIGLIKTNIKGSKIIKDELKILSKQKKFNSLTIPDLFNSLIKKKKKIFVLYIAGQWLNVNDVFDLAEARKVTWAKSI